MDHEGFGSEDQRALPKHAAWARSYLSSKHIIDVVFVQD
jgi:hypothetical protein